MAWLYCDGALLELEVVSHRRDVVRWLESVLLSLFFLLPVMQILLRLGSLARQGS